MDEVAISKSTRSVLLTLPTLSPRDESIARAIMASLALRDTRLDQDFVRALVDPDRQAARSVDLALVRRLVLALSPGHADGALDPERTFAERDARGLLARALSTLAVSASELSSVSDERAQEGTLLLRARLSHVLSARPGDDVGAELRALTQLTRNDRALLSLMYATAQSRGSGLDAVDGVAGALLALRSAERMAPAEQPAALAVQPLQPAASTTHAEGSGPAEAAEPPLSWWPRGYGSATQLAARLTGSYASVEAAVLPNSFVQGALAGLPTSHGYAHAPPLNIAQVLGLSALVSQVHTRSLRARRQRVWRRRDDSIRGVEAPHKAADESEAQELLEGSERRRRAYHALMQRRRRARALRRASDSYALSTQP